MRFRIDAVFCDEDLRVLAVAADVPKRSMRGHRGAKVVVELPAGEAESRGLKPGDELRLVSLS